VSDSLHHNSALHFPHETWPGATKCARIARAKLSDLAIPGGGERGYDRDAIMRGYSRVARINFPRSPFLLLLSPLPLRFGLTFLSSAVREFGRKAMPGKLASSTVSLATKFYAPFYVRVDSSVCVTLW